MLLTRDTLPETISDIAALDDLLCRPSQALIDDLTKVDGDIMILGVAGKMGPTLARPRQSRPARPPRHRRRPLQRARLEGWLQGRGIETIACDLLDEAAIKALPKAPNIVFMAGRKFGAEGNLSLTWAMNAHVPALVAQAFRAFAHRRVLDRLRLSVRAGHRQGRRRELAPDPPGEYAQSCVGRERMFEYFSRKFSHAGPAVPAELRDRHALRRAARHRHQGLARASRSTSASAMSISSGRATPRRRRCAAWRIATRRPRRSMSAATRFSRCAISRKSSARGSAASPSSSARKSRRPGSPIRRRRQNCSACRS